MPAAILIPPEQNLFAAAARLILDEHAAPDLSAVTFLVPSPAAIRPLRRALAEAAGGALLGPHIVTLQAFAQARGAEGAGLSALDSRLLLASALENYLRLFPGQDALALAEEFYALFEDLSAHAPQLAEDEQLFLRRVEQGYGASIAAISQEAQLVHTLWRAFLAQTRGGSPRVAYQRSLKRALQTLAGEERVWLIGFDRLAEDEAEAVRGALAANRARVLLHGRMQGRDGAAVTALCALLHVEPEGANVRTGARGLWLDAIYSGDGAPLRERLPAVEEKELPRLQAADGPEHEARIADLAIRQWLLAGKRDIAVIAQDRRYSRRLRALLERAGVLLSDEVGWALSTSAAAASLVHWLDVCEMNFSFRPLLDLLKSSFFAADTHQISEFERAIYMSGTAGGFKTLAQLNSAARALLKPLEAPARLLAPGAGARPAQIWCEKLMQSLQALPLWATWQQDDAGLALAAMLEELQAALRRNSLSMDWRGFRRLLERSMESATFAATAPQARVRLLTLEQARGLSCDALILAGAAAGRFPGEPPALALFNHAVHAELGLPGPAAARQLALARFRGLLQAAPEVLITWAPEQVTEPAEPCDWAALLAACGAPGALQLAQQAGRAACEVAAEEIQPPARKPAPRPPAPAALWPASLSASAHQHLIECPYRFYASAMLGLKEPEEPDEPFSPRDFGQRVHAILQGFTQQQDGLPPPFGELVNAANSERAATRLDEIGQAVFAQDLASRALAQAWLEQFRALIPRLVGWLTQRSAAWPLVRAEDNLHLQLTANLRLHGRLDRREENAAGEICVVDYKTGRAPKADEVENGESVQAVHYALLAPGSVRVEYLLLGRDDKGPIVVEGDALDLARSGVAERLIQLRAQLAAGAPLPAQGDDSICDHCGHRGICRKGAWDE